MPLNLGWSDMRVGNLSGRGTVYRLVKVGESQDLIELKGEILLNAGERLLGVLHNQLILFHGGWSNWGPDPRFPSADGTGVVFYDTDGRGSLYITDSRVVFLRIPDLKEVRRNHHGHDGYSKIAPLHMAQAIINAGALEYCEIRYSDVVKYKEKKKWLQSFLMVDGRKYRFMVSKEAGEVLLPHYRKRLLES
jgi:hypothetical protein